MSVAITSLLSDKAATILVSLALYIFTVSLQFFINRNQVLLYFSVSRNFHEYFIVIYLLSFGSKYNLDQWYQSRLLLIIFFQFMSPMRSEYIKLGLKLVSLEENPSRTPRKPSMVEEKKNDGEKNYINMFLEQALA